MNQLAFTLFPICINHLVSGNINPKGCGVNSLLEDQVDPRQFIVGEAMTGPGSWPWVCSVGFHTSGVWEHQCGGTLVTYRHVLTAAHCLEEFKEDGRDERIKVQCGDFNLIESMDDGGVQVLDVSHYDIHDAYNFPNYDISVLVMKTKFHASTFIRPICLENSTQVHSMDGVLVLGWGMDRNREWGKKLNLAKLQIDILVTARQLWRLFLGLVMISSVQRIRPWQGVDLAMETPEALPLHLIPFN
jgi:hypothetical protein